MNPDAQLRRILRYEDKEKQDIYRMLCITGYELGDLMKAVVYMESFNYPKGDVQTSLADLINMANVISILYGYDFEHLRELGVERMKERLYQMNRKNVHDE